MLNLGVYSMLACDVCGDAGRKTVRGDPVDFNSEENPPAICADCARAIIKAIEDDSADSSRISDASQSQQAPA